MTEELKARIAAMAPHERAALLAQIAPRVVDPYVPHVPHPPQIVYLLQQGPEAFYGGAAGGGKSDALLMAALQYADVPGYSALILRRNFNDLALPGAIMDRADSWLRPTDAKPRGGKSWLFPTLNPETGQRDFTNPARLTFGYLQYHKDTQQYYGAEFQFIAIDEVTQFEERTYSVMFARLRGPSLDCTACGHGASKLPGTPWLHDEGHPDDCECEVARTYLVPTDHPMFEVLRGDTPDGELPRLTTANPDRSGLAASPDGITLADVPLRMRTASNPGGIGHAWARDRFVDPDTRNPGVVFVPAKIQDNPSLDRRAYRASLSHLGPLEQQRLEQGNWDVGDEGEVFQRHWFQLVPDFPRDRRLELCRAWDLAATAAAKGKDPDWTVGALLGLDREFGMWYLIHLVRLRGTPLAVENTVIQTAASDKMVYGRVAIRIEQEPGSSGVNTIARFRSLLPGYDYDGVRPTGTKPERARPVARAAEAGNMKMVEGAWNQTFLDEAAAFPKGSHDDQIDAVSAGFEDLAFGRRVRILA